MIKKFSLLFMILFTVTLVACSSPSNGNSNNGSPNSNTKKTYLFHEGENFQAAAIVSSNGIYAISFSAETDTNTNNVISGTATKNGNTYTCSDLFFNITTTSNTKTKGTLTITIDGSTAKVTVTGIDAEGAEYLNGIYTLTETDI